MGPVEEGRIEGAEGQQAKPAKEQVAPEQQGEPLLQETQEMVQRTLMVGLAEGRAIPFVPIN